jgi:Fe(3+) dicitrate transport protein
VQNIQLNSQSAANPLIPELARTTEFGARYDDGNLHAEITAFKLRFDNQIQQVPNLPITVFQNIGATKHQGVEVGTSWRFDRDSLLTGLELYANATYTKALQQSGTTTGLDLPFYSRETDTLGAHYTWRDFGFDASTTHQTGQFADNADTFVETASGNVGRVPGFRLWNAQVSWKPSRWRFVELEAGVNNLADKRYFTRNVDGNFGRMVGAPRMVYAQARLRY